ncbi:MAG: peptidoglycan bridge formation glycyltransferase FemA/FemB family protein [Ancrocorticia sp.]
MRFTRLTRDSYAQFMDHAERAFYSQLPAVGELRREQGQKVEYVGVVGTDDEGREVCLAAGLLTFRPWRRFFERAHLIFGPTLDWTNDELIDCFFTGVRAFLRSEHPKTLALRVNPLLEKNFYEDIEIVASNPVAAHVDIKLRGLGCTRIDKEFYEQDDIEARFAFVKDVGGLSFKEAVASCGQVVRTGFNRVGTNGVRVEFKSPSDIGILKQVLAHTAERTDMHAFDDSTFTYYQDLMEHLGPDEAFLPVAILNCQDALDLITTERDQISAKIGQLTAQAEQALAQGRQLGKKQRNAMKECESRLEVLERRASETEQVRAEHGNEVILAASLFIHSPHELVYLVSGAYAQFQSYYGIYLIHRAMMEWATSHQVRWYNMFGITGDFTENASDAGVLHFKRQFKGNVEEYAGTYILPIRARLAKQLAAIS